MQKQIDENLLYYFPNNIANRWLAIRLEFIGNLVTLFAAFFAVISRDSLSAGIAALSIYCSINVKFIYNSKILFFFIQLFNQRYHQH